MGTGTAKKAPAKAGRSPAATRRSASRSIKAEKTPSTPSAKPASGKKKTSPTTGYTHRLPTAEDRKSNGRVAGRSLIVWGRPRMAEKLLLHVQYECARHKCVIPWDTVAHRLHPGSSGAAIIQHLNRIRRELVAKGHLVPPLTSRSGTLSSENSDPRVRGFVRTDMEGEDKDNVRPVGFDEVLDDRKFSLPSVDNFEVIPEDAEGELEITEDTENEGDVPQLDPNHPSDQSPNSENHVHQQQPATPVYQPLQEAASFVNPDLVHPGLQAVPPTANQNIFGGIGNPSQQHREAGGVQNPPCAFPAYVIPNVNPMIYSHGMSAEPLPFPTPQGQKELFEQQANFFAGNGTAGPKGGYAPPMPVLASPMLLFAQPPYPFGPPWGTNPMHYMPFSQPGVKMEQANPQVVAAPQEGQPLGDGSPAVPSSQLEHSLPVPDSQLEHSSAVPDSKLEPSFTAPDSQLEPPFTLPDSLLEPSFTIPDSLLEPSFTIPNSQLDPSFTLPDSQLEHSSAVPDSQLEPSLTLPDSQLEHSFPIPGSQLDPSFTIPDSQLEPSLTLPDSQLEQPNMDDLFNSSYLEEVDIIASVEFDHI